MQVQFLICSISTLNFIFLAFLWDMALKEHQILTVLTSTFKF